MTKFEKIVVLRDKMTITKGTTSSYVAHDSDGKRYLITSCVWATMFNPEKQWLIIEEGCEHKIYGYGVEIPIFDWCPYVFAIEHLKHDKK
jgi:hypothetical protein